MSDADEIDACMNRFVTENSLNLDEVNACLAEYEDEGEDEEDDDDEEDDQEDEDYTEETEEDSEEEATEDDEAPEYPICADQLGLDDIQEACKNQQTQEEKETCFGNFIDSNDLNEDEVNACRESVAAFEEAAEVARN